jgi:bacteriocin biosynthesis cyclodehydratase domain-containing protein
VQRITLIPFDEFGRRVAAALADSGRFDFVVRDPDDTAAPAGETAAMVTAGSTGGTAPAAVEQAVRRAQLTARPRWLPIRLEPSEISVGPWMAPAVSCPQCYEARRAQHDGSSGRSGLARAALGESAGSDLWSFLPPQIRIAAAIALERLTRALSDGPPPAREELQTVVRCRFGKAEPTSHRVVPRSGCERCGDPAAPPGAGLADGTVRSVVTTIMKGL